METLDIEQLAAILKRSPHTVRSDVTRRPETLPPRIKIPGTRRVLWRKEDVERWMSEQVLQQV